MRGSIVKRGKGYSVVVELDRDPVTGKRRQKWHSGYRTKRSAEDALAELVSGVNAGTYVVKTRQTVGEYSAEWLAAIEPTVRPSTFDSYRRTVRLHVVPYLGAARLTAVDAGALNRLYADLLSCGRKTSVGGLSPRSVAYVHAIVHRMFRDAVKWGRLARNPADAADPPRGPRPGQGMRVWSGEDLRRFLASTTDDAHGLVFHVLATTGMRRGEALGLRWADVDLEHGRAAVRQTVVMVGHTPTLSTPKTNAGRRGVALDADTVARLREHRRGQAAQRLQLGAGWRDNDLVFTTADGSMLHPERVSEAFGRAVRRLGLPSTRLHDLRHGWATLALSNGVHPKVVQERLGHASIGITLDTYSHVAASLHDAAAETVASAIFGR